MNDSRTRSGHRYDEILCLCPLVTEVSGMSSLDDMLISLLMIL